MTRPPRGRPAARRGGAYVLVLTMAMILTTLGLTVHLLVMQRLAVQRLRSNAAEADLIAMSAIDLALHRGAGNTTWSTSFPSNRMLPDTPIGRGSAYVVYSDTTADPLGPKTVRATAARGEAVRMLEVGVDPLLDPIQALSYAMSTASLTSFDQIDFYADRPVHTNGDVAASSSVIDADIQAYGTITGGAYKRSVNTSAASIPLPPYSDLSYYLTVGVSISINSLPSDRIERVVLSPASNPFGATHPDGVYVIRCDGRSVDVRDCRIVGTLVLHQAGSGSRIHDSVLLEKGGAGYPVLIVDGDIEIKLGRGRLSESSIGVNFNPVGSPSGGVEDNDLLDTYPSMIRGLIYSNRTISITGPLELDGLAIAREIRCFSRVFVLHDASYADNPPPGFGTLRGYEISHGTWRRAVNP